MKDITEVFDLLKDSFKGTRLWGSLMILSGYVFLIALMFAMMSNTGYLIVPILTLFVIWLFVAYSAQREAKIRVLRKDAGRKVLLIELGEGEDMGEIVELKVKKITPFKLFTATEQEKIGKLTEKEREMIADMEKVEDKTKWKKDTKLIKEKKVRKDVKKIENK